MAFVEDLYGVDDAPYVGFEPIPVAKYTASIVASDRKETAAGDGNYLALTFEILDGPFKGRKLWDNLNMKNKSQKAVEIALAKWASIRIAVGIMKVKHSDEVHNIPLMIDVGQRKREDTGEIENFIKGYHSKSEAAAKPSSAPNSNSAPPWARK